MKQRLTISTHDLIRLKRREAAGHYSPILIGDQAVAMANFMAEDAMPTATLEMALAEKADNALLPFFYVRHDAGFTRFHVTSGNMLAAAYLSTPKTLTVDGLAGLFAYCSNR